MRGSGEVGQRKSPESKTARNTQETQQGDGGAEGDVVKNLRAKCPHHRTKSQCWQCRGVKRVRRRISEALQAMQWAGHLRAQPHKRVQASSAGRASLSITTEEASASNAVGKAYVSTPAEEAAASNTGGQASGVSCP